MTLVVDGQIEGVRANAVVEAGQWGVLSHPTPDAVVAAIGGLRDGDALTISLEGKAMHGLTAGERHSGRLCVSGCRLDPLPALRVADVVGLGVRAPQPPLWQALVGTSRSRGLSADDEAMIRALAGRVGLARWVDRTAVALPLKIEALADITRALAGLPEALVWRRPEWLDPQSLAELNEVVVAEQRLAGFAVLEVAAHLPGSLSGP